MARHGRGGIHLKGRKQAEVQNRNIKLIKQINKELKRTGKDQKIKLSANELKTEVITEALLNTLEELKQEETFNLGGYFDVIEIDPKEKLPFDEGDYVRTEASIFSEQIIDDMLDGFAGFKNLYKTGNQLLHSCVNQIVSKYGKETAAYIFLSAEKMGRNAIYYSRNYISVENSVELIQNLYNFINELEYYDLIDVDTAESIRDDIMQDEMGEDYYE